MRGLLTEIYNDCGIVTLYNDNQSAQKIANNKMCSNRTKHIDIRFHFVREAVINSKIVLRYMSTDKMLADIMTKPLGGTKFKELSRGLSLYPLN